MLIAGLMANLYTQDDKHLRGLLWHHGFLDFYTVSKYDFYRRSLIYEDRFGKTWTEIVQAVLFGVLAPLANDLDALSAVEKDGKQSDPHTLQAIASASLGCNYHGPFSQLLHAAGLAEHVRDPL